VFGSEGASEAFERALWETVRQFGWRVHAYVIMSNHYVTEKGVGVLHGYNLSCFVVLMRFCMRHAEKTAIRGRGWALPRDQPGQLPSCGVWVRNKGSGCYIDTIFKMNLLALVLDFLGRIKSVVD
jgi:hypothetical protein